MDNTDLKSIKIEYICELRPRSKIYLWDINGATLHLGCITFQDTELLIQMIKNIKIALQNATILVPNDVKGGKLSPLNIMKLMISIYPELSKEYIQGIISDLIKSKQFKTYYKYSAIFAKAFDNRSMRQYIGLVPQFDEVIYQCIVEAILRENNLIHMSVENQEIDLQYISRIGDNFHLWSINGSEIQLFAFNKYYRPLLLSLCYKLKEKMLNREPLIEELYDNFFPKKTCGFRIMPQIAYVCFPQQFIDYVNYFANEYTQNRTIISREAIMDNILGKHNSMVDKNKRHSYLDLVEQIVKEEYEKQCLVLPERNFKDLDEDIWKIATVNEFGTLKITKFEFERVSSKIIRHQVKDYCRNLLDFTNDFKFIQDHLNRIVIAFEIIQNIHPTVKSCSDVDINIVYNLINALQMTATSKLKKDKFKLATLNNIIGSCRKLFNFLVHKQERNAAYPRSNPFNSVAFHNVDNIKDNTLYIPESVVLKLLKFIDNLPIIYQRILLIAMNTGLRFKEIAYLDENCLSPVDSEQDSTTKWKLEFVPWKILEARRSRNLDDYTYIVIDTEVANEIIAQKRETEEVRENFNTSKIFLKEYTSPITTRGKGVYIVNATDFNRAVNKLIKQYRITDDSGLIWEFNSKQCRKTVAVDMITNGAKPQEVTYLLGHLQEETTNKFYSEVRRMKLAEMNSEFFRKKFNLLVTEEQLATYSEEERRLLYVGFCTDYREVELGKCIKPFWEGTCKRIGEDETVCATCDKLCTSLNSLPKWQKLRDSKQSLIDKLEQHYAKLGIEKEEYLGYREYQREMYLLNAYIAVINKIEERIDN
jgi:site-specific recombinase XerD